MDSAYILEEVVQGGSVDAQGVSLSVSLVSLALAVAPGSV